jgi:threonine-phosphate decarboxylase
VLKPAAHGGDRDAIAARYGIEATSLIDFSANIDPYGPPPAVREILASAAADRRRLTPYPSRRAYERTCSAIALAEGLDPDGVVIGPGAAALIDVAVRALGAETVMVPVPAFSEYERAIEAARKKMRAVPLPADFQFDLSGLAANIAPGSALLVNTPHNPSGIALSCETVESAIATCERQGAEAIVDEAFVDYIPDRSAGCRVQRSNAATVVRSLTKFYALAGVRVGYAVAAPERAARLRAMLPSWPVGTLELEIARACVEDRAYGPKTRERVVGERAALVSALEAAGIASFPSVANFLLLELPCTAEDVDGIFERLVIEHGILVRDCRSYRGLEHRAAIRVAVLDGDTNRRLVNAFGAVLSVRR